MNYRAGIVLWNDDYYGKPFNVSSEGVIELGTISMENMITPSFKVVVPGIKAEENYTLSVTCNGKHITAKNNCGESSNSYERWNYFPYYGGDYIHYASNVGSISGVNRSDGTEFHFKLEEEEIPDAATSAYKYVFALSDGKQLYYYTKPKDFPNTIADKSAIKLPEFDGKTTQTKWKTTLE